MHFLVRNTSNEVRRRCGLECGQRTFIYLLLFIYLFIYLIYLVTFIYLIYLIYLFSHLFNYLYLYCICICIVQSK